jgi:hypothetical protein
MLVIAAVLVVALAVVVAVFAVLKNKAPATADDANGPLPLVAVPAPQAGTSACASVIGAMPQTLTSNGTQLARRTLAQPAPKATVAWGTGDAIVLRCGLDRPDDLTRSSELRVVNGVQWLQVTEDDTATWYVVDRGVYLALTVPNSAGTGPLQTVADVVAAKLPAKPLTF